MKKQGVTQALVPAAPRGGKGVYVPLVLTTGPLCSEPSRCLDTFLDCATKHSRATSSAVLWIGGGREGVFRVSLHLIWSPSSCACFWPRHRATEACVASAASKIGNSDAAVRAGGSPFLKNWLHVSRMPFGEHRNVPVRGVLPTDTGEGVGSCHMFSMFSCSDRGPK